MKRYQVFVSSTYTDLKSERQAVIQSVLKLRHIPVGMEHFVAANEEQFSYIKRLLDETDYYIIIIGNRYGTTTDDGISYTEKEFDYAVNIGIPIIACIHSDPDSLPLNKSETDLINKEKLIEFRKKVTNHRLVSTLKWNNPSELSTEVVVALINAINDYPRTGWERVTSYENSDLLNQINDLRIENENLKDQLEYENLSKQQEKLVLQFPWDETYSFKGHGIPTEYKNTFIPVSLTWAQIFSIIGPILLTEDSQIIILSKFSHALFLDTDPQFRVDDLAFQLIIAELFKYGIIDIENDHILLTKIGKQCLNTKRIPVCEKLNEIHTQVVNLCNDTSKKFHGQISEYIRSLSQFHSNPESINYIGQTLLSLRVFLNSQNNKWDKKEVKMAQKEIEDILEEASESKRMELGVFEPVFNLSKISKLIDFLNTKLQDTETKFNL